jgi:hypothetical protein
MTENSLAVELERLRMSFSNSVTVAELDSAIARVAAHRDSASIGPLLLLLDDNADYDEAMFSLIHAAEEFDDVTYVKAVLEVIVEINVSAPKWASIVLTRILNSQTAKYALVSAVRSAGAKEKLAIGSLCEAINRRSAEFLAKTMPLLLAAQE